jgi:SAM-dependent methyltransferase
MLPTLGKEVVNKPARAGPAPAIESPALAWLWKYLSDIPRPHVLDCGNVKPQTVEVLVRRGAKVFVADLVTLIQRDEARFWDRSRKVPVFLAEDFLAQMPAVPAASLSAIFCWHVLDLLPREVLPQLVERLFACLRPGGVLFCLLREPYLKSGAESVWWMESLTTLTAGGGNNKPFAHPVVSGRDLERLLPGGSVKSFLTRSGRREVLVLK